MKRILVVDDERQITRMLRVSLQTAGYAVQTAQNGLEALQLLSTTPPDLVITDLAMPEMNGVELTEAIRQNYTLPIIVLSVRDGDAAKIRALDKGADDYVTKPFSIPELLARVRAQLRRHAESEPTETHLEAGDFVLDTVMHTVLQDGKPIHLTPKEFDLLLFFLRNPERVLTHKELLRAIWGAAGTDQPEYLRVLVGQLRKKISRADRTYVQSEPWVGYRFVPSGLEPATEL